jgi:Family of unknown function (DUF5681)
MAEDNNRNADRGGTGEHGGDGYDVGYGKPPNSTRFRKGQSGNPKGRPRGAKNFSTILAEELQQPVVVRENGRQKAISKLRASIKQLVNKAASGEPRAIKALFDMQTDLDRRAGAQNGGVQRLDESDQEVIDGIVNRLNGFSDAKEEEDGNSQNRSKG